MTIISHIENPQTAQDFAQNVLHVWMMPSSDLPYLTKHFISFERALIERLSGSGNHSSTNLNQTGTPTRADEISHPEGNRFGEDLYD